MAITFSHGQVTLQWTPPPKLSQEKQIDAAIKELGKAKGLLKGEKLDKTQVANLRAAIGDWIKNGTDGMMSLNKALSGGLVKPNAPKPLQALDKGAAPPPVPVGLEDEINAFHIGTEQELREIRIQTPKGEEMPYSYTACATKGTATIEQMDDKGKLKQVKTDWPLMSLTTDQTKGDSGCIEVVFGPIDVTNSRELNVQAKAMAVLQKALKDNDGGTLVDAIKQYNKDIKKSGDKDLKRYELAEPKVKFKLVTKPEEDHSIQTNVELPLAKLGDPTDTTIEQLFALEGTTAQDSNERKMFSQARLGAEAMMNNLFRPTANSVEGGVFKEDTIKLQKLRGAMTMMLYSLAKTTKSGHISKGAWPLLPKSGWGDIIRDSLSARDKLVLFKHTSDPVKMKALSDRVLKEVLDVRQAVNRGASITTEKYHARVKNEKTNKYEDKVLPSEQERMEGMMKLLLEPGGHPKRYGTETTGYGKVDWTHEGTNGSITGKPIKPTRGYVEKQLTSAHPKIVVEVRFGDQGMNKLLDRMPKGGVDVDNEQALKDMRAAAAPQKKQAPKGSR